LLLLGGNLPGKESGLVAWADPAARTVSTWNLGKDLLADLRGTGEEALALNNTGGVGVTDNGVTDTADLTQVSGQLLLILEILDGSEPAELLSSTELTDGTELLHEHDFGHLITQVAALLLLGADQLHRVVDQLLGLVQGAYVAELSGSFLKIVLHGPSDGVDHVVFVSGLLCGAEIDDVFMLNVEGIGKSGGGCDSKSGFHLERLLGV